MISVGVDPKAVLIEAGKAYVRANASAAGRFESEIEDHVPGLVDALLAALSANKLGIYTLTITRGKPMTFEESDA